MSVKDDLMRNRRIFELLTEPENNADSNTPPRQTASPATIPFETDTHSMTRQSFHPQNDTAPKTETFSLEFGRRVRRETGMALTAATYGDIEFPKLKNADEPLSPDPLEKLYHQLETEARRSSQLLVEEEY